jgi:hypothetical protein
MEFLGIDYQIYELDVQPSLNRKKRFLTCLATASDRSPRSANFSTIA